MISYIGFSVYYILISIIFLKSKQREKRRNQNIYLFFTLGIMCIIFSLRREDIGNDTRDYLSFFKHIATGDMNWDSRIEIGYRYLTLFISKISHNPHLYIAINTILVFAVQIFFVRKFSESIEISTIIYWLLCATTLVSAQRQGIAMGLVQIGYLFLRKRKQYSYTIYFIFCILGALFHVGAIVMIFIPFLQKIKLNEKRIFLFVSITIVGAISGLFSKIFNMLLTFFSYYSRYSGTESGIMATSFRMCIGIVAVFWGIRCQKNNEDEKEKKVCMNKYDNSFFQWSSLLFGMTSIMAINLSIMGRIAIYFMPFMVIYLANSIFEKNTNLYLCTCILALFGYNFLGLIIRPEWNSFYPFYFFWQ